MTKARSLDASVVAEFVEPGNSAQSIEKRPVFKQLLAYLEDHREVDYVIVYMRSRAFRNSIDAAITKRALSLFGIRIPSCKEDFGTGPVADAMETVSDAFNELQVRQNGEDIRLKLRHKALGGGTITRAKLGYLNTRAEHEGRLFNSIEVDPKRAALVRQASSSTPPASTQSTCWSSPWPTLDSPVGRPRVGRANDPSLTPSCTTCCPTPTTPAGSP